MAQKFASFCNSSLTAEEARIIRNANYGTSVKSQIVPNNKIGFAYFIVLGERALLSPQNTLQLDRPKLEERDLEILEELLALMTIKKKTPSFRGSPHEKSILTIAAPVIEKLMASQRRLLKAVEQSGENISATMKNLSFVFLESCAQHDIEFLEMVYFRRLGGKTGHTLETAYPQNVINLFPQKKPEIEVQKIASVFKDVTSLESESLTEEQRTHLPLIWNDYVDARTINNTNIQFLETIIGFLADMKQAIQTSLSPASSIRHRNAHYIPPLGLVAKP